MLLGEELDTAVKNYIKAVCDAGGLINASITIAAATAIVCKTDRSLLLENGGFTTSWAKSLLYQLNLVKRRGKLHCKDISDQF